MLYSRTLKHIYPVKLPSYNCLNYLDAESRMVVARDGGKSVLLIRTAPYFDSAHAELHPLSHSLICSLVVPCVVGREGPLVPVLPETQGHIVEHPQGWMKRKSLRCL